MSEITLRQIEKQMFVATDSYDHSFVIGSSPDDPKKRVGVKASDLLLMAAAACSTYDVVEILAKQREIYRDLKVTCSGDQLSDPPYTFTRIHLHYIIAGEVNPKKLMKAIKMSVEKYCSVISTIRPDTPVTYDYEMIP